MKNLVTILLKTLILTSALYSSLHLAHAVEKQLDKVAAIVNGGVVLESEITDFLDRIKKQAAKNNQSLPSNNALRTQVMDKLINDSLLLQIGERMGVQVSDAQLDQTIANLAKENSLSLSQFRQALIDDGGDYEKYRENVRVELMAGQVRRNSVQRRIYISPQEVTNLLDLIKEQTSNDVEYHLGHILIEFPTDPTQADLTASKQRADKVIKLLEKGSDFKQIAIASSGGSNALEGGDLGWKNINEMPTLFSELIEGKEKGTIVGPIRTGLGFSIVKLLDIRGRQIVEIEEVKASHILIKPSIILSEEKAQAQLQSLLDKIEAGETNFSDAAKEFSEGPTSVRGGDLGWADPSSYDVAFKEALATMKIGEYHKPFRSSFGWHIIQLNGRRMIDATSQMNKNRAYQMLHNRKFALEDARWMKETRDQAYIKIFEQDK